MTTIPALIRDLHAAGWTYRLDHEESPRDYDGAPEHEGWYVHRWRRGTAEIQVPRRVDAGLDGDVVYYADVDDDERFVTGVSDRVIVGLGLVQRHGAQVLRSLGEALGVLTVDVEDAAWRPRPPGWVERPAPVGSWWQTDDGAAYVDGDYLDGPGDQIITYALHKPDGSRSLGKWGGREFADAYTRLDGPPAWCAAQPNL